MNSVNGLFTFLELYGILNIQHRTDISTHFPSTDRKELLMEHTVSSKKLALNGVLFLVEVAILVSLLCEIAGITMNGLVMWVWVGIILACIALVSYMRKHDLMLTAQDTAENPGLNTFRLVNFWLIRLNLVLIVGKLLLRRFMA